MTNHEYLSPRQIVASGAYPFSIGQIRHYLTQRHRNGLGSAVRKVGKRVYLRRDLFDAWIERQGDQKRGER